MEALRHARKGIFYGLKNRNELKMSCEHSGRVHGQLILQSMGRISLQGRDLNLPKKTTTKKKGL